VRRKLRKSRTIDRIHVHVRQTACRRHKWVRTTATANTAHVCTHNDPLSHLLSAFSVEPAEPETEFNQAALSLLEAFRTEHRQKEAPQPELANLLSCPLDGPCLAVYQNVDVSHAHCQTGRVPVSAVPVISVWACVEHVI